MKPAETALKEKEKIKDSNKNPFQKSKWSNRSKNNKPNLETSRGKSDPKIAEASPNEKGKRELENQTDFKVNDLGRNPTRIKPEKEKPSN